MKGACVAVFALLLPACRIDVPRAESISGNGVDGASVASSTGEKLRQLFQSMLSRLRAGDIEGALSHFTPQAAERYRPAFEELKPKLATVADEMGTLVEGTVSGTSAEYLVVQLIDGKRMGFFICFSKGVDGIWRIKQL